MKYKKLAARDRLGQTPAFALCMYWVEVAIIVLAAESLTRRGAGLVLSAKSVPAR